MRYAEVMLKAAEWTLRARTRVVVLAATTLITLTLPLGAAAAPRFTPPDITFKVTDFSEIGELDTNPETCPAVNDAAAGCLRIPWIGEYISGLYAFGVSAASLLAVIVLMVAGYLWLTAGGNPNLISLAKNYAGGAVIGLILMLGSYVVLYTVNPALVRFQALSIPVLKRVALEQISQSISGTDTPVLLRCTDGTMVGADLGGIYASYFSQAADTYNIDPVLLAAIARVENAALNPTTTTSAGPTDAFGLMQMTPGTAYETFRRNPDLAARVPASCKTLNKNPNYVKGETPYYLYAQDCKDFLGTHPDIQIEMGAAHVQYIQNYLASIDPSSRNDIALIAGSYFQGEGNGRDVLRGLSNPEMQALMSDYFQKVMKWYEKTCPAPTYEPLPVFKL